MINFASTWEQLHFSQTFADGKLFRGYSMTGAAHCSFLRAL